MKRIGIVLLSLLLATSVAAQVILQPDEVLGFDYSDQVLIDAQVSKFQAQWDNTGVWNDVPATGGFRDALTSPGASTYRLVPPFTSGNHTVQVRACNGAGCGPFTSPFAFAYATSSAPALAPTNIRKIPR